MEIMMSRLSTLWARLQYSTLSSTKVANERNIADFTRELNLAAPVTDYERGAADSIRHQHRMNKAAFMRYVSITDAQYLVLFTDARTIATELGLDKIVLIRWNLPTREFIVSTITEQTPLENAFDTINDDSCTSPQKNRYVANEGRNDNRMANEGRNDNRMANEGRHMYPKTDQKYDPRNNQKGGKNKNNQKNDQKNGKKSNQSNEQPPRNAKNDQKYNNKKGKKLADASIPFPTNDQYGSLIKESAGKNLNAVTEVTKVNEVTEKISTEKPSSEKSPNSTEN
jgi:hypothetical protein